LRPASPRFAALANAAEKEFKGVVADGSEDGKPNGFLLDRLDSAWDGGM
jgi:hypothetical protein